MRILFYIEHFKEVGGAENYAVSLCKELSARGHEIYVICRDGDRFDGIRIYNEFNNIKAVSKKIQHDVSFDWGLFERADISRLGGGIHKFFIDYAIFAYPIFLRPIKWLLYRIGKHKKKIRHQKYVLSSPSTFYIAPSCFIKRHAVEYGIPSKRIKVLYNGVDLKRFIPEEMDFKLRAKRRWGIEEKNVVFLFVAHNLRLKNLGLLKRVFDRLYKKHSIIRLMVVGKRRPGFSSPYLIYTGAIQDMRYIYSAADVLLHPSYFDTFGSVVIEAMASGIPVVVSKFVGASEIIEDAGVALPVKGKGIYEMWEYVIKEMLNRELRLYMGQKARLIAEKYDFSSYVDKVEEILNLVR